jgi:hypothetical protein
LRMSALWADYGFRTLSQMSENAIESKFGINKEEYFSTASVFAKMVSSILE